MHSSEPFVLGGELTDGQKLAVCGTFLTALLAGLFVGVGVEIVVMNVFGGVLSVDGVGDCVESTVGNVVPAGLRLVRQEEVSSVLPSEPLVHLLRQVPNLIAGLFMEPVVKWAVELIRSVS